MPEAAPAVIPDHSPRKSPKQNEMKSRTNFLIPPEMERSQTHLKVA